MSNVFYVLTNKINMEHNIFKIGIHTGDRKKLLTRYKTQLVSPQILRFIPHKHANLLEQTILAILDDKRTIFDSGKKSEWITYPKDDLLKLVDEEKDKCIVKTITTESAASPPIIKSTITLPVLTNDAFILDTTALNNDKLLIGSTPIESAAPPVAKPPSVIETILPIAKPPPPAAKLPPPAAKPSPPAAKPSPVIETIPPVAKPSPPVAKPSPVIETIPPVAKPSPPVAKPSPVIETIPPVAKPPPPVAKPSPVIETILPIAKPLAIAKPSLTKSLITLQRLKLLLPVAKPIPDHFCILLKNLNTSIFMR